MKHNMWYLNVRKMKLVLAATLMVVATSMSAGPADPGQRRIIRLDDGTEKTVQLMGDEYGYYWKATDDSGCYRERLGRKDSYQEVSELDVKRNAASQRRAAKSLVSNDSHSDLGYPCTKLDLKGRKRALALLVDFQDKAFSVANVAEYHNIFSAAGYTTGKNKGSVKDYFLAQSNDLLELDFDVVGPVKVSKNSAYYGAPTETQNDAHAAEMVSEAVALADAQVDYSEYDWDGDGTVEMIVVIFAGLDQSTGGVADDIWAHQGNIDARYDHVYIQQYACAPELRKIKDVAQINSIGTICHEMSHAFGLPDTYDSTTGNYGTNRWDLMGIGVHNDNGYTPAGYTAYDKMYCLWQSPVVLRGNKYVRNMRPMSEGGNFYLIPNDAWEHEFFLLENRQQTGWDSALPGHGMLIMHVDYDETLFYYNITNRTGTISGFTNNHERLGLVLADNDKTVDNSNYTVWQACLQGDLYPYKTNNSLTNTSNPSAKLFNKNIDNTYLLSKPVTDIKENADGSMRFRFSNNLASQNIVHLSANNGKIRFVSDTEAKLVVDVKNDGYADYAQKLGVYVSKTESSFFTQQPQSVQMVNILVGGTSTFEFPLSGLADNTDYYAFLFYLDPNSNKWVQMSSAYPFNMSGRNTFNITMDEESMVIRLAGNKATLEATFRNESYKKYTRKIGVYTYIFQNGENVIQEPRAFVNGNIEPYSDKRLSFTLNNLEEDVQYRVYFYYYADSQVSKWTKMCGPFKVICDSFILGDVNSDGSVTPADAIMILYDYFGVTQSGFNANAADVNKDGRITPADAIEALYRYFGTSQSPPFTASFAQ